ncbi:MAG: hypothetical protein GX663_00340 [Clostridiales bacterium]|nr:hypothetical protein [Clostridiales bacterium]
MKACLEVYAHYIDLGGLFHVTKKQLELEEDFKKTGLTAVLGMGSTPGTMNVMAGYAASGREMIAFSEPIGAAEAFYCIHSEPVQFAKSFKDKGIKNASIKLSLPAEFEERISFLASVGFATEEPVKAAGYEVNPLKTMVSVVNRYLERYDGSQDGDLNDCDVLRAVVTGTKDGVEKEVAVECVIRTSEKWGFMAGALDTGVPPSIVVQMICNGQITERGSLGAEMCVPPIPYFKELAKRQMPVYCVEKTPFSSSDFMQLNREMYKPK